MATKRLSELSEATPVDATEFYTQVGGVSSKVTLSTLTTSISSRITSDLLTTADVTYENLNSNADVGQNAGQVAAGNDARFPTSDQKAAMTNASSPAAGNPFVTESALPTSQAIIARADVSFTDIGSTATGVTTNDYNIASVVYAGNSGRAWINVTLTTPADDTDYIILCEWISDATGDSAALDGATITTFSKATGSFGIALYERYSHTQTGTLKFIVVKPTALGLIT